MQTTDGIHKFYEGDVQYPFADVGAAELLHISEVTQENRRTFTYTCPYCKKGLRPRLGSKKNHCFAHKPNESCELDRYIHKTAERLLKEKWDRDEPFEITMKVRTECKEFNTCVFHQEKGYGCVKEEMQTYDLKKQFTRCVVEKKVGEFVPDLCLVDDSGKHEPIFIEIWSKHKNSEKKAQSKYRIIEIRLKTIKDLEELPKHPITESDTVTFSHFKTINKPPTKDDGPALMRYTLYAATLNSFVDDKHVNCCNYRNNHYVKSIFEIVCSKDEIPFQKFRNYCNAIAIDRGYSIRNCYLCQLFGIDNRDQSDHNYNIFTSDLPSGCRRELGTKGLIPCKPKEDAKSCQHFKLKESMLSYLKSHYFNINRYIWIKNEDGSTSEEIQNRKTLKDSKESESYKSLEGIECWDWIDEF
jgi:hypothetical protein